MKEISFETTSGTAKEPLTTKYTLRCETADSILIIQKGPESCKMLLNVSCAKKLMEAMEYVLKP